MILFALMALLASSFPSAEAQDDSTGVIQGAVVSYETEEPLPGANIVIAGIDLGVAADQEGRFVFRNLPAGTYQIEVSLIGYLQTKRTEVEITPGQTTSIRIRLRSTPIILDREVRVVGERPMLDIKLPATRRELTPKELELVPAADLKEIVSQQVGVIQDQNELHIRGGRSYENLFLIDDLLINDPFTRSGYGVAISPSAIEKLNLVSGGLSA